MNVQFKNNDNDDIHYLKNNNNEVFRHMWTLIHAIWKWKNKQTQFVILYIRVRIHLTCFDRYWLSTLRLLSTCLDMLLSDDRLNSKFSIVSFGSSWTTMYNKNKLARPQNTYSYLKSLNHTVGFVTRLSVWSQHKSTFPSLAWKSCPHVSEAQMHPGRAGCLLMSRYDDVCRQWRRRLCGTLFLRSNFHTSEFNFCCYEVLPLLAVVEMSRCIWQ